STDFTKASSYEANSGDPFMVESVVRCFSATAFGIGLLAHPTVARTVADNTKGRTLNMTNEHAQAAMACRASEVRSVPNRERRREQCETANATQAAPRCGSGDSFPENA